MRTNLRRGSRGIARRLAYLILPLSCLALCACNHRSGGAPAGHARLFDGMGAIHHRIATANRDAQKFFDQGLALVYAFNFGEAINSFERAAELDPDAAMPYWGIALAYGPNYNAWMVSRSHQRSGFDAIQTAAGLAPNAPEPERAYIEAMARLFTDDPHPDQPKLARDYSDAMRAIYRRYPDDPDAAALFAASLMNLDPWHLWKIDGQPGPDTPEIVAVLGESLRRWPEHTGVNHFYIHTMEGSGDPERALPSARRLETLAPAAGHLVHMPSHIYLRVGDYAAAVRSNQQAIAADRNYRLRQPAAPPGVMGYSNHNQDFLAVAAGMDGEFETALNAAQEIQSHMPNEAMAAMPTLVLMRFARWDEVLRSPAPAARSNAVTFFWRLARGCAYASRRRLKEADDERAAMERAFSRLPEGRAFGTFFNDWSTLHSLAVDTLSARIAAARGDADAAIGLWRQAVAIEDGMNFDDVPDWYCPIRESLGAALLGNRQAIEAEQVFREDLRRNPRNPRSLFGLSKALEAQRKMYEADLVRQSFEAAWKGKQRPRLEDF
jgi:tetratricopeptide (TPR) repeat protein